MDDTFKVTREDNCVWIEDLRDNLIRHIVPDQAQELADKLKEILKDE